MAPHAKSDVSLLDAALSVGTSLHPNDNAAAFLHTFCGFLRAEWGVVWMTDATDTGAGLLAALAAQAPAQLNRDEFLLLPDGESVITPDAVGALVTDVAPYRHAACWRSTAGVLLVGCRQHPGRRMAKAAPVVSRFFSSLHLDPHAGGLGYRSMVEAAEDLIYRADLDGTFRYANPVAARVMASRPEDLIGHLYLDFVRPDYRDRVSDFYDSQVADEVESTYLEFPAQALDGREIWLGQHVRLERDRGEIVGITAVARDVTQRVRAETERLEGEEKYRSLFEHSNDAIIVHDLLGGITDLNRKAEELFGYPHEALSNMNISALHPAEELEASRRALDRVLKRGETTYETQFVRADGSPFRAEVAASQIVVGGRARVLGIVRDVTERRRAQEAVLEVKNLYEQILNAIPSQIALFDANARYEYVSPSGIKDPEIREWIIGKTNEEYCRHRGMDEEIGRERTERIMRIIRTGQREFLSEAFSDRAGEVRHFVRYLDPIRDASGNVTRTLGWGMDITDLKRTEAALRESEARKSAVLETALDCIISIDEQGRVVDFNPAAERTFGHRKEDVVGRVMADMIIPPQYRQAHIDGMAHYMATGEGPVLGKRIEITALNADGVEFPIELAIQPLELEDHRLFTAYVRDISERVAAEQALLEANERAAESAAAKERFLANMSHEMRTPLNGLIGTTHLLADTELNAEQRRFIKTIQFASDNLLSLINDVLDFAKVQSGKVTFESVPFSLAELCDRLDDTFGFRARVKGLSWSIDRQDGLPDVLLGDPVRLSQILMNLISNAIKFTADGSVRLSVASDRVSDDAVDLRFDVADTGIGIEADLIDKIFDSFIQASSDTTRRFGGTGLGLAIVKELAEHQDGSVSVNSQAGLGSVFTVCLSFPIASNSEVLRRNVGHMPKKQGLAGRTILVAEDNEINQFVVCSMLHRWGASSVVANNGREAVDRVARESFDAVLMDIQMPELDGHDACVHIRQRLGIGPDRLPIIALTASTAPDEQHRLLKAGMQDFIMKPFDPNDLYERIIAQLTGIEAESNVVSESDTPDFDEQRLSETSMDDRKLAVRFIDMYLEEAGNRHQELLSAGQQRRWEDLRALAHQLKSSSGMLGLVQLQRQFESLESHAKDAAAGGSDVSMDFIEDTADRLRRGITTLTEVRDRYGNTADD